MKSKLQPNVVDPPTYFKLGKLISLNEEDKQIHIQIDQNMPIANCGDGVSVNEKAARILSDLYGLDTPGKNLHSLTV